MKEPMNRAFSSLEELFDEKAMKKMGGRMSNISPFNMATMVIGFFYYSKKKKFAHLIHNVGYSASTFLTVVLASTIGSAKYHH